jgi:hypothetical protein
VSSAERAEALTVTYIARQIETATQLFRVNPAAVDRFDTTADGFFRSFLALLIAAPFAVYQIVIGFRFTLETATAAMVTPLPEIPSLSIGFVLLESVQYVARWVALPVVLGFAARPLNLAHRYVPFVVAYNWATLVGYIVMMVPMLLYGLGVADLTLTHVLLAAAIGFTLYYGWSVAVSALQVPPLIGVAVVAFDFLLSAFISVVFKTIQLQLFPA